MKVLVIGATGTMGRPMVEHLADDAANEVYALSRSGRGPKRENVRLLKGDALDPAFMRGGVLRQRYDAIVDFVWYTADQFAARCTDLLNATEHYIVMSSAAVCADSDVPIREDMPRYLDLCPPEEARRSREYHLEKARIEDTLRAAEKKNWTVIRPHLTFGPDHLPLCTWEKGDWLYRVLQHKTIVLAQDMLEKRTVLTYGGDAAKAIIALCGVPAAFGQIVNVTCGENITNGELLAIYQDLCREVCGTEMKVILRPDTKELIRAFPYIRDRVEHDRALNRTFSVDKLNMLTHNTLSFMPAKDALRVCMQQAVAGTDVNTLRYRDGHGCAWMDRIAHEYTSVRYFNFVNKGKYLLARYLPSYYIYITLYAKARAACKRK